MTSRPRERRPFVLSATVDFPDDVRFGKFDLDAIDRMMVLLKRMGVRRVNWMYYGDTDPNSELAGCIFDAMKYGRPTLETIGEPVKAVVPFAHRHGLELYAVLKPYNTGVATTEPDGSPRARGLALGCIGGKLPHLNLFIRRNPHTRLSRRPWAAPNDLNRVPVNRICLRKRNGSPTRIKKEQLEIWTSTKNYGYERFNGAFNLTDSIEPAPRDVRDYFGEVVTRKGDPVRTLTLTGLNLTAPYVLVTTTFGDNNGDFQNTPLGIIEVFGPSSEPLPIVLATRYSLWNRPRNFRNGGLDFDSGNGPLLCALDVNNELIKPETWWSSVGGCIAFARGKNDYLPCAPCEVFPEVQKLWLGWIDRLIDAGVDGVDVRVSAHSTLTDEPAEYGFNDVILSSYRERFGNDLVVHGPDATDLANLRGEHYTAFVRQASRRLRKAGKKVHVHVHTEAFRQQPCHGQLMGIPANIHFDWKRWMQEGLVDGITLRTSWYESMEGSRGLLTTALSDPVVEETLALANRLNLPVSLNRYLQRKARSVGSSDGLSPSKDGVSYSQGAVEEYLDDLERVYRDARFQAFDIYEFALLAQLKASGGDFALVDDIAHRIGDKARKLGILL